MSFLSVSFALFFACVLLLLKIYPGKRAQQRILLAAGWVFYAAWDWRFLLLLLGLSTAVRYLAGRKSKASLTFGIALCLGVLGVFKYLGFFVNAFCARFGAAETSAKIILPLGLSYYVLQAISYLVDVYRGQAAPAKLPAVQLYIGFFPLVTAGPIVKAREFLPQLDRAHPITAENLSYGIQRFCLGLFKKLVIADRLGVCVDAVFSAPAAYSGGSIALAVLSYAVQLYCDFSGYSDMAIGVGRCMGFDLGENFRLPYTAASPGEFWHRWHRSLSSWLRDYVYIPLGGSRRGGVRTCCNLMAVMLLSGLWHGAGWIFFCWGAFHGAILVLFRLWPRKNAVATFLLICLGWIPFRAESLTDAWTVFSRMVTLAEGIRYTYSYSPLFAVLVLGAQTAARKRGKEEGLWRPLELKRFSAKVIFCVYLLVILLFACMGDTAFLYGAF